MAPPRRCLLAVAAVSLLESSPGAAQPIAPYVVTATPIHVGLRIRLCIAIDPIDPQGVWWWGHGPSGCVTRSTGPDVFHSDEARVSPARDGLIAIEFRLGTHSIERPTIPVRLMLDGHRLRSAETGDQVDAEGRPDLIVPEEVPRFPPRSP